MFSAFLVPNGFLLVWSGWTNRFLGRGGFLTFDATAEDKNGFREKRFCGAKYRISLMATVDDKLISVTCRLYSSVAKTT